MVPCAKGAISACHSQTLLKLFEYVRVVRIMAIFNNFPQGDSVFKEKLKPEDIDSLEFGETSVELLFSDKHQEKLDKLEIGGELSVSFISGLVKVNIHITLVKQPVSFQYFYFKHLSGWRKRQVLKRKQRNFNFILNELDLPG